jgi:uncharacterized membrane protein YqjE
MVGSSMIVQGSLCVLFALAIIAAPELLAYIVAAFFLLFGLGLIATGWKLRRW